VNDSVNKNYQILNNYDIIIKNEEDYLMDEKRRNHRLPIDITLIIESLYNQGDIKTDDLNEKIHVVDISRGGIAFEVDDDLPLNYYFNAEITIDSEKKFFTVIKIIRKEEIKVGYHYGCEFIGLANVLSDFVDEYEKEGYEC
jgi:hypothetical protein